MNGIEPGVKPSRGEISRVGSIESLSEGFGRTFEEASRVAVKDSTRQEGYKNKHISLFYINPSLLPAHARAMCACVYATACGGTVKDFGERLFEAIRFALDGVSFPLSELKMSRQSCLNCCFYDAYPNTLRQGACRRHPPVVPLTYQGRHDEVCLGLWPRVEAVSWCGQHQPRTNATSRDETNEVERNTR